jgi:uncharacterized protein YndB with AHSA1/START domain
VRERSGAVFKVRHEVTIERKPEEVFAFLSDLERVSEWQQGVIRSQVLTPGPVRVGTRFTETAKVGPWRLDATCEVTAYEPARRMAFTASSKPIEYGGEFTLEPLGSGTRLSVDAAVRLKGFWRLMQPVMAGEMKSETRKELETIKRVLEGTAGAVRATA